MGEKINSRICRSMTTLSEISTNSQSTDDSKAYTCLP